MFFFFKAQKIRTIDLFVLYNMFLGNFQTIFLILFA